jgi:hypothetical protein
VDVLRPKPESPGSAFDAVGAGLRNGLYGSSQEEGKRGVRKMDQQDKLRAKLVEYVQNVHAMEQNVS